MRTALRLMILLGVVVASTHVFAEARAPQLVITAFVEALQKDDMEYLKKYVDIEKVRQQPKHGYTVQKLKELFADVDVSKIECSKPIYKKTTRTIRVNMNKPLSFNFQLQHQNAVQGEGDFYRIIGIHP